MLIDPIEKVGTLHILHGFVLNSVEDHYSELFLADLDKSFLDSYAIHFDEGRFSEVSAGIQKVSKFYEQLQEGFVVESEFDVFSELFHVLLKCLERVFL